MSENKYPKKKIKCELFNDHFENAKRYQIPKAQLIIADLPYNLGSNAYASNPSWYVGGDNANGESESAGKQFFDTDDDFKINNLSIDSNSLRSLKLCSVIHSNHIVCQIQSGFATRKSFALFKIANLCFRM